MSVPHFHPNRSFWLPSGFAILVPVLGWLVGPVSGASPEQLKFFEQQVRPILSRHCFSCHGPKAQKGGLRLDQHQTLLRGGESGAAIVPGNPQKSLLVQAINYESYEMPPKGKLGDSDIEALTRWVAEGAPWPDDVGLKPLSRTTGERISKEDRQFWAFQPLQDIRVPRVEDDWIRNDVDRFILARLDEHQLRPSSPADRRRLIRRVTFDLHGLPPTPEEVRAFVEDERPAAYEQLVTRLLKSPRFGEHWARYWLDLVRYAESDGYKQDAYRPNAYRYRDYVIRAFNQDKPYDEFIMEQLAGDEVDPQGLDSLAATSYLRHWIYEYNQRDVRTQWTTILNDVTDVTGEVFLGLTVGCARCHDHKFDPILQEDYFRLQAFFAPILPRDDIPYLSLGDLAEYEQQVSEYEQRTTEIRAELASLEADAKTKVADAAISKFPKDIRPLLRTSAEARTPYERQLADLAGRQIKTELTKIKFESKLKGESLERWRELRAELAQLGSQRPTQPPMAFTVTDIGAAPPPTHIPDVADAAPIEPGFLSVLDPAPAQILPPPSSDHSTGRRYTLARWMTNEGSPLTSRVIVNRIWQQYFGRGIVATASNFGKIGQRPTHPELLDWLATNLIDNGWSLKSIHRMIVLSATYQQATTTEPADENNDPDNLLLWRMRARRLSAEQIRDAALAASGDLKLTSGGPAVKSSEPRRAIYTRVVRNTRDPLMAVFDAPDGFSSTPERVLTTTPTQALMLANGDWMLARATSLARQLSDHHSEWSHRIEAACWRVWNRGPTPQELVQAIEFVERQQTQIESGRQSFPQTSDLAQVPNENFRAVEIGSAADKSPLATEFNAGASKNLTVEATVWLRSLYEDASVRTIASNWNSNNQSPGWSLGVTSTRSQYDPRNLIVQLVGKDLAGKTRYEVVASDLRLKLQTPYYVAAQIKLADEVSGSVRFFLKDLSQPESSLVVKDVTHPIAASSYASDTLVLGGRRDNSRHTWDGFLREVRLAPTALKQGELLGQQASTRENIVHWRLDRVATNRDLTPPLVRGPRRASLLTPEQEAFADFCHVLLNSNEFLYVE